MKEVVAIIRANKIQKTKEALARAGFPSMTVTRVMGRGKQKGLHFEFYPPLVIRPEDAEKVRKEQVIARYADYAEKKESGIIPFIPKRMISMVVPDEGVEKVVQIIIQANQTGSIGDGRIFVLPVREAIRVRTEETGNQALM